MIGVLERLTMVLTRALLGVAGMCMAAMVLLTGANIVARLAWVPLRGTFEMMGLLGALVAALSLAATQRGRGHIAVDIVVARYPRRWRKVATCVSDLLCSAFFLVAAWQIGCWGTTVRTAGEVTETLHIPFYPVVYGVAAGVALLGLVCVAEMVRSLCGLEER